jgi:hypothetical protein
VLQHAVWLKLTDVSWLTALMMEAVNDPQKCQSISTELHRANIPKTAIFIPPDYYH